MKERPIDVVMPLNHEQSVAKEKESKYEFKIGTHPHLKPTTYRGGIFDVAGIMSTRPTAEGPVIMLLWGAQYGRKLEYSKQINIKGYTGDKFFYIRDAKTWSVHTPTHPFDHIMDAKRILGEVIPPERDFIKEEFGPEALVKLETLRHSFDQKDKNIVTKFSSFLTNLHDIFTEITQVRNLYDEFDLAYNDPEDASTRNMYYKTIKDFLRT